MSYCMTSLPGDEILASLPQSAEKIDCGKYGRNHTMEQDEIEALIVDRAKQGMNVVRLKGGDPFLFGRGGEELKLSATRVFLLRWFPA